MYFSTFYQVSPDLSLFHTVWGWHNIFLYLLQPPHLSLYTKFIETPSYVFFYLTIEYNIKTTVTKITVSGLKVNINEMAIIRNDATPKIFLFDSLNDITTVSGFAST